MKIKHLNIALKNKQAVLVLLICISSIFLLACESSVVKPEVAINNHPEWDEQTIAYIRSGLILEGMTKEQVRAAWGMYCEFCQGTKKHDWGETWEYTTQVVFFGKDGKVTKFVKK